MVLLYLIQYKRFINIKRIEINKKIILPKILIEVLNELKKENLYPIIVGGSVRDSLLKKRIKDFDIEVFLAKSIEELQNILARFSSVKLVGKSFGVLKLNIKEYEFDFSLPRIEEKIGNKHSDFKILLDSNLTFKQAARRRDFTINAIGYDYFKDVLIDPFNGKKDLKKRRIKHIDNNTFIEDSLRVYRAIGFASRFNFKISKKTKQLCKNIVLNKELEYLSKERIFEEFKKFLLQSKKPSIAFKYLKEFEILEFLNFDMAKVKYFDSLAKILSRKKIEDFRKIYLFFTLIVQNLNLKKDQDILDFLLKFTQDQEFLKRVVNLSNSKFTLDEVELKKASLRIIIEDLFFLEESKNNCKDIKKAKKIATKFKILNYPLKAKVYGKDLIDIGITPSKRFKEILDFALDLQIRFNLSKKNIISEILKKEN